MLSGAERVKRWRRNVKSKVVLCLGGKCVCCGYKRGNDALDVHHLDPKKKEFSFRDLSDTPKNWHKVVKEFKKCVLLCKICHTEHHAGIRKIPKNAARFDENLLNKS